MDENDGNDEPLTSFFFLPEAEEPLPLVDGWACEPGRAAASPSTQTQYKTCGSSPMPFVSLENPSVQLQRPPSDEEGAQNEQIPLDSIALKSLCSPKDRKRSAQMDIIEVSGSSLLGDPRLLTKQLTQERPVLSFKRKSDISSLQRRKHQITYLAAEARAQELELKNHWAKNRTTRKQTRAKYGF